MQHGLLLSGWGWLSHILDSDLGYTEDVLVLGFVEVGEGGTRSRLNLLEFDEGTALGEVDVDLLDLAKSLKVGI